ncbi:helicase [Streptomyces sp. NPDC001581]
MWLANTKSRRDKVTEEPLAQLAEVGLEWFGPGTPNGASD